MCGIGGWISDKPVRLDALNTSLLLHLQQRGSQSAGLFVPGKGLVKMNVSAEALTSLPRFARIAAQPTRFALMHTRMPTSGGQGPRQAQPFCQGVVATVHNGMLLNTTALKARWQIRKPTGVDSELITSVVNEYGIDTLGDFLESTTGPSAVGAWFNRKLYLVSYGNPIAYTFMKYRGANLLVFASTEKILHDALDVCGMHKKCGKIYKLRERRVFEAGPNGLEALGKKLKSNERGYFYADRSWSFCASGAEADVDDSPIGCDEADDINARYEACLDDYLC